MSRMLLRLGVTLGFLTLLLVVLVLTVPGRRGLFLGLYELAAGGVAILALIRQFRLLEPYRSRRSPFERASEEPEPSGAIPDLDRIDRLVVLGSANSFDLHYRLRPLLRELASARLHAQHGVDLDRDPRRARRLLGDELWEVVRADLELTNRFGPGVPPATLERLVARLETL